MRARSRHFLIISACALAATGVLLAQNVPGTSGKLSPVVNDENAIREAAQLIARTFEKDDAKALAACFTENCEYVDEGSPPVRGREALAKSYAEFFSKRSDVKAEAKTQAVRFLSKDTAVEEGTFTVKAKDTPASSSRYS